MTAIRRITWFSAAAVLLSVVAGCDGMVTGRGSSQEPASRPAGTVESSDAYYDAQVALAMEGTVGSEVYLEGNRFMRVRGIGLVVGLNGKGTRFCPPTVREELIREIRRHRTAQIGVKYDQSPEALIDSMDTSVVVVTGDIPAGVGKGKVFDVTVSATTISPDTRSLAGGYLLPCELHIFRETAPGDVLEGKAHGKCRGLVFINPFAGDGNVAGVNPLEGRVIGGAVNLIDRRLALKTIVESYFLVEQISMAIQRRFPDLNNVADGTNPSHINLRVPKEFEGREGRFIEIVRHLPLSQDPVLREARANALVRGLAEAGPPPEETALSLEGIGPGVIPMVQELYTHPRRQVNYYAARTGLRLGDELAVEVMRQHAMDERSPFCFQAIRELGDSGFRKSAGDVLRGLLALDDLRVRILAYEALRTVDRDSMASAVVGPEPGNFVIDVVPSEGRPLIYARRTATRRIALIGADQMRIRTPLFCARPEDGVTLSAKQDDRVITLLRKVDGNVAGTFLVEPDVVLLTRFLGGDPAPGLNKRIQGIGLGYSAVLGVLHHLCETGALTADLKWEEESITDWIGPIRPMARPESEL